MERNGSAPFISSTRMDLNHPPIRVEEVERVPISLKGIRFECRPKVTAKDAIVHRYGEEGYDKVIQDLSPFIMVGMKEESIIIFILY